MCWSTYWNCSDGIPLTVREEPRNVLMFPKVAWRTLHADRMCDECISDLAFA
jgi:hypothetical protein